MEHSTLASATEPARPAAPPARRWALWGIVALAVALRVLLPGGAPLDEAAAGALLRAEAIRDGALVYTGAPVPTGELMHPPAAAYVDALLLALWPDPRALVVLHGVVAGLAAVLLYDLARRAWGRRAGVIAALAYALHPWAVHAARDLAPAAWVAPIAALALHGLALVFCERDPTGWLEAGLAAGLALATHLAAWPIVALALLPMAFYPRQAKHPEAAIGWGAGLLVALPHLAYQIRYGGYDLRGALGGASAAPTQGLGPALRALVQSASTWGAPTDLIRSLATALAVLSALVGIMALVMALVDGLRRWSGTLVPDRLPLGLLLNDWLILGMIGVALTSGDLGLAGRAMLIPAACVAMGGAIASSLAPRWQRLRNALLVALLAAFGLTAISGYAIQRPNLRDALTLRRDLAQALTPGAPTYLLVQPDAAAPGPYAWRYLLRERAIVVAPEGDGHALPLPLGRAADYVLTAPGPQVTVLRALGAQPLDLPSTDRYAPLAYQLPAADPAQLLALPNRRSDVAFAAGIHLLGYTWPTNVATGAQAHLMTTWLVTEAAGERQPQLLLQLLTEAESRATAVRLGLDPAVWQPDTAIVAWHPLPADALAADPPLLALGFYDALTLAPYPPAGSTGDALLLPIAAASQ